MNTVITTVEARRSERYHLLRHFVEMALAMLVGMVVLGAVAQVVCAALGHPGLYLHHVGLRAPLIAMNMAIGMAVPRPWLGAHR